MNIILKSILSLKHMRHSYSSQAIEEKAKIQGQLLQFNDFIFIWMGTFLKGIVPHHCLKSIQAIWWPPEKHINQDSMAVSWFLRNIIPSSQQNYLLGDKFSYGESVHLSLLSGLMCDRNLRREWKMERPAVCTSTPGNLIKLCLPWKTAGTNCAVSQSNGPESSLSIFKGWMFSIVYTLTAYLQKQRKNNCCWWLNTAGVLLLKGASLNSTVHFMNT